MRRRFSKTNLPSPTSDGTLGELSGAKPQRSLPFYATPPPPHIGSRPFPSSRRTSHCGRPGKQVKTSFVDLAEMVHRPCCGLSAAETDALRPGLTPKVDKSSSHPQPWREHKPALGGPALPRRQPSKGRRNVPPLLFISCRRRLHIRRRPLRPGYRRNSRSAGTLRPTPPVLETPDR